MTLRKTLTIAVAVLVIGAGAIGAVTAATPQAQNDHSGEGEGPDPREPSEGSDSRGEHAREGAADERANATDGSERRGPPVEMPDPAPDYVGEIHRTIREHLDGVLNGSLGEAVSSIAAGDSNGSVNDSADGEAVEATGARAGTAQRGGGPGSR